MDGAVSAPRKCLPVEQWPLADQAAWNKALQPFNPFKPGFGGMAKLAATTQRVVAEGYGYYLRWLHDQGLLDPGASPGERVPEPILLAYQEHLECNVGGFTVAARVQQLGIAIRAMAPHADHAAILRAAQRIRSAAVPRRNKRDRMQAPDKTEALALELLRQATDAPFLTQLVRARLYRDGLIILFLTYRANRMANLTAIEIGRHLVHRGETLWLVFQAEEMKNRRAYEMPLPDDLATYIDCYITQHRPVLLACARKVRPPTQALWISSQGTVMTACAIALQVRSRTKAVFGKPMTPHFFRDALATAQADNAPECAADTAALLGHASSRVAEKHYNQSSGIKARERYAETVAKLRSEKTSEEQF